MVLAAQLAHNLKSSCMEDSDLVCLDHIAIALKALEQF